MLLIKSNKFGSDFRREAEAIIELADVEEEVDDYSTNLLSNNWKNGWHLEGKLVKQQQHLYNVFESMFFIFVLENISYTTYQLSNRMLIGLNIFWPLQL
jgi:hypothetical protein